MKYTEAKHRVEFMRSNRFVPVKTGDRRSYYRELFFDRTGRPIKSPALSGKLEDGTIKCVIKTSKEKVFGAPDITTLKRAIREELKTVKSQVRELVKNGGSSREKR